MAALHAAGRVRAGRARRRRADRGRPGPAGAAGRAGVHRPPRAAGRDPAGRGGDLHAAAHPPADRAATPWPPAPTCCWRSRRCCRWPSTQALAAALADDRPGRARSASRRSARRRSTGCCAAIAAGALGTVTGVAAVGAWQRDDAYYARSPWAGRRSLDGRPVLDGALANPFAHALMQCLAIAAAPPARRTRPSLEVERYRTRPIEVDDTAVLRVTFAAADRRCWSR